MGAWTWWLRTEDGAAKRITPGGVLIGRSAHCDIVSRSEQASRRHALVYLSSDGPHVVPLGKSRPEVDGKPIDGDTQLDANARISMLDVVVDVTKEKGARVTPVAGSAAWVIEGPGGGLFGIGESSYLVGGSPEDDLVVEGWPEGALCFRIREDGSLEVEPSRDAVLNDAQLDAGAVRKVRPGDVITMDGARIKIVTGGEFASGTTATIETRRGGVRSVRLEFLPRGGRLHLTVGDDTYSVYLTDRRADLVAVLLKPPDPHEPGDFLEDSVVLGRVWGRKRVDRTNLNVLLHRIRKDLGRIGLDGTKIIERSEGGGATRFILEEGASVDLE